MRTPSRKNYSDAARFGWHPHSDAIRGRDEARHGPRGSTGPARSASTPAERTGAPSPGRANCADPADPEANTVTTAPANAAEVLHHARNQQPPVANPAAITAEVVEIFRCRSSCTYIYGVQVQLATARGDLRRGGALVGVHGQAELDDAVELLVHAVLRLPEPAADLRRRAAVPWLSALPDQIMHEMRFSKYDARCPDSRHHVGRDMIALRYSSICLLIHLF